MWLNKAAILVPLIASLGCSLRPAAAVEVCPAHPGQALRFVDVFDGSPEDLATLVPDEAKATFGYWRLGYVYDAGRFVTIRCKYADKTSEDVKLSKKIQRCDYKIDAREALTLSCH